MKPYRFLHLKARLLITAFILVSVAALLTGSKASFSQDKELIDAPTPVEIGMMTEKQKAHSKLHPPSKGRKKLLNLIEEPTGDIEIVGGNGRPLGYGPMSEQDSGIYPNLYLKGISNDADAIVIGIVKDRSSNITADETFIFTDYEVAVEEFLKPNRSASAVSEDHITVTRLGGAIQLRGKTVHAKDLFFQPFRIGKRYLLFLKYVPATSSYRAFRNGSFLLADNYARQMTQELLWVAMSEGIELKPFLTEVRDAIANARNDEISGIKSCCFRLY